MPFFLPILQAQGSSVHGTDSSQRLPERFTCVLSLLLDRSPLAWLLWVPSRNCPNRASITQMQTSPGLLQTQYYPCVLRPPAQDAQLGGVLLAAIIHIPGAGPCHSLVPDLGPHDERPEGDSLGLPSSSPMKCVSYSCLPASGHLSGPWGLSPVILQNCQPRACHPTRCEQPPPTCLAPKGHGEGPSYPEEPSVSPPVPPRGPVNSLGAVFQDGAGKGHRTIYSLF